MKLPTTRNLKPLRRLAIGERAVFAGAHRIEPHELTVLDVHDGGPFSSGLAYLILVDDAPAWFDSTYLWPLDQLAMIERMICSTRQQ